MDYIAHHVDLHDLYNIYNAYWPAILRYVQLGYKIVQYNQTEVRHKKGIRKSWGHD